MSATSATDHCPVARPYGSSRRARRPRARAARRRTPGRHIVIAEPEQDHCEGPAGATSPEEGAHRVVSVEGPPEGRPVHPSTCRYAASASSSRTVPVARFQALVLAEHRARIVSRVVVSTRTACPATKTRARSGPPGRLRERAGTAPGASASTRRRRLGGSVRIAVTASTRSPANAGDGLLAEGGLGPVRYTRCMTRRARRRDAAGLVVASVGATGRYAARCKATTVLPVPGRQ